MRWGMTQRENKQGEDTNEMKGTQNKQIGQRKKEKRKEDIRKKVREMSVFSYLSVLISCLLIKKPHLIRTDALHTHRQWV